MYPLEIHQILSALHLPSKPYLTEFTSMPRDTPSWPRHHVLTAKRHCKLSSGWAQGLIMGLNYKTFKNELRDLL